MIVLLLHPLSAMICSEHEQWKISQGHLPLGQLDALEQRELNDNHPCRDGGIESKPRDIDVIEREP